MILPGVIASSGGVASSYESIATQTVTSGSTATLTFSSIPTTFAHLQLRCFGVYTGSTSSADDWYIQFNSDTTAVYDTHNLYGNGSTATATADTTSGGIRPTMFNRGATNGISIAIMDILDYTSTSKQKTLRALGGFDNNGSGTVGLSSGLWRPSSIVAINRIDVKNAAGNFLPNTHVALYGVKA